MRCRHDEINPNTGLQYERCDCSRCLDEQRRRRIVEGCEIVLRAAVVQLLEAGAMPDEIAQLVRDRSPKSSRAWMLTRIELTCQAGYWMSRPDWASQLDQVDQLCKYTGFHVGTTIPGWMQHWWTDKAGRDDELAVRSVRQVRSALSDLLTASAPVSPVGPASLDLAAGARPSVCMVLPFRHRLR